MLLDDDHCSLGRKLSLHFDYLVLDVLHDFGIFVDLIEGNEGEDVLCGLDLLLQLVVELQPNVQQH